MKYEYLEYCANTHTCVRARAHTHTELVLPSHHLTLLFSSLHPHWNYLSSEYHYVLPGLGTYNLCFICMIFLPDLVFPFQIFSTLEVK